MSSTPIRVAIVNDYEIVVAGVAAMLAPHRDRVVVVELDSGLPVVSDVDVILYDTFGQVQGDAVLADLLAHQLQPGVLGQGFAAPVAPHHFAQQIVHRALAARCAADLAVQDREVERAAVITQGVQPGVLEEIGRDLLFGRP